MNLPSILAATVLLLAPGFLGARAVASDAAQATNDPARFIIVVGAPGEAQYTNPFTRQADAWSRLAHRAMAQSTVIGLDPAGTNDLESLQATLASLPPASPEPLFLVLVGHGTHDGRDARFNLRGPDLTATNLQRWLAPITRPTAVINLASASAPFINALARSNRVVLTATRSGNEVNATRLGDHLADLLGEEASDLDQDGDVTVLEAFLAAAARTAESYKSESRLATEHPLLDDNADGRGTPAEWFKGTRATKKAANAVATDGLRAHQVVLAPGPESARLTPEQRSRRDDIERQLEALRASRPNPPDDAYWSRMESLLLELARVTLPSGQPER
jgi:hypothetical protein